MTQQEKDQEFLAIKLTLVRFYGLLEADIVEGSNTEQEIHAESLDVFFDKFNEEYYA